MLTMNKRESGFAPTETGPHFTALIGARRGYTLPVAHYLN